MVLYIMSSETFVIVMQADDIRDKYLQKAAAFVTSSRDSWTKKRQKVIKLNQKVCIVRCICVLLFYERNNVSMYRIAIWFSAENEQFI